MFLKTNSKYYTVDVGLRNCLVKSSESDIGHILENIVFLELKRRGYDVYIGQLDENEIDFVAVDNEDISYYQVSATTLDENTLRRELAPLKKSGTITRNTCLRLTIFSAMLIMTVSKRKMCLNGFWGNKSVLNYKSECSVNIHLRDEFDMYCWVRERQVFVAENNNGEDQICTPFIPQRIPL